MTADDPEDDLAADWDSALGESGDASSDDDEDMGGDDWGAALSEQGVDQDDMGSDWAAMLDEEPEPDPKAKAGDDRILNQDEIDNLLGFDPDAAMDNQHTGIRAIIESAMVSYERLPMLEIVFDRLVRLMTTSLRNFTSDNVEVSLDSITSVRFGDYLDTIPLPAMLSVFKAKSGTITV